MTEQADEQPRKLKLKRSPKGQVCVYALGCDRLAAGGLWLCGQHLRRMKKLSGEHREKYEAMMRRASRGR
jgi:hypothetical protein